VRRRSAEIVVAQQRESRQIARRAMVARQRTMPSKSIKRGLTLLGRGNWPLPSAPSATILETFPNRYAQRDYWIRFECSDFTSLCPVTGQPDFAHISVDYVPDRTCIETKSLKFYLNAFRSTRSFNEEVANRILEDLVAACAPRRMIVQGQFAARGGISVTVQAEHPSGAQSPLENGNRPR